MKRSTEPTAAEIAVASSPPGAARAVTPSLPIRFYIDSWEIAGGAPRPVVGQPLDGYRVVFRPSQPEDAYGLAALDEDIEVEALPPEVVVPPDAQGGLRRGHLQAEWHVTPSEGALYDAEGLSGLVVRTRVISLDRQLTVVDGLGPAGEAIEAWSPISGTLSLREVTGAEWDFDRAWLSAPSPPTLGDVRRGDEGAVLVDLQVLRRGPE